VSFLTPLAFAFTALGIPILWSAASVKAVSTAGLRALITAADG